MIKYCLHCGNDVLKVDDQFCCLGCDAAYKIINKFGFKNYYNLRQIDPKIRKIKPEEDDKILIDEFVNLEKNGNYSVSLMVQGIHCAACVWLIENILKKQESVVKARINLSRKTLFLEWKESKEKGNEIVSMINEIGYKLLPFDAKIIDAENKKYDDSILKALAVAGFGAGNVMLFSIVLWITNSATLGSNTRDLLHFFSALLALPIIIYSSRPFFLSAYKSIKAGYPNMDLAISIAIFLASTVSLLESFRKQEYVYFDSAIMLIFFLLIGRYLDLKARKKAFCVASEFSLLAAGFGKIEIDGKTKIIPSKEIKEDMVLIVSSGEKIVADGFVIDGESEVDASLINGETVPKKVVLNSEVYSGMINLENPIKIKVNKNADKSLLAQIVSLSLGVEETKNHYVRLADRLSKFYTPAVHLIAFLTFILWFWYLDANWESSLMKATAVLIITCPCALALAVPIVQTIAISNFIKKGLLVKSGEVLEKLKDIDVVVFDKTGTLTLGKPQLVYVLSLSGNEAKEINLEQKKYFLRIAASIARKSSHVISKAILMACEDNLLDLEISELKGFGLISNLEGKSLKLGKKEFCEVITNFNYSDNYLSCFMKFGDQELVFLLQDKLKEDAKSIVTTLKKMKKRVILLSGDIKKVVSEVASEVGIDEFYFEKIPTQKLEFLNNLRKESKKVLMIGDGLNDAPSLAAADVSISFANATDISQNIADVVIHGEKLFPIISLINSSKKAIYLMKQNLLISLIYNLIALPFAIAGFVVPLVAAFAMSSSSILVLLNSLRMNKNR